MQVLTCAGDVQKQYAGGEAFEYSEHITLAKVRLLRSWPGLMCSSAAPVWACILLLWGWLHQPLSHLASWPVPRCTSDANLGPRERASLGLLEPQAVGVTKGTSCPQPAMTACWYMVPTLPCSSMRPCNSLQLQLQPPALKRGSAAVHLPEALQHGSMVHKQGATLFQD